MEFDKSLIAQELSLRMHRSNWPLLCLLYLYVKKKNFLPFFHPNFFLSIDAAYCVCTCLLLHLCFVLHRICNVGHLLRVSVFRACLTFVHLFSFCYIYTDWGWGADCIPLISPSGRVLVWRVGCEDIPGGGKVWRRRLILDIRPVTFEHTGG